MSLPARAAAILNFWTEIGPQGWYAGGEALDVRIRDEFLEDWTFASHGGLRDWASSPEGILAYLILTDQFPRNMFRGVARAFATDSMALSVAARSWQHGIDSKIEGALRQFLFLPLMHSECPFDQHLSVCLFAARMDAANQGNLLHARAHRQVIRDFGRFPYRNEALGRRSTQAEVAFLQQGGYGALVRSLEA